jgi:hypothetical protein
MKRGGGSPFPSTPLCHHEVRRSARRRRGHRRDCRPPLEQARRELLLRGVARGAQGRVPRRAHQGGLHRQPRAHPRAQQGGVHLEGRREQGEPALPPVRSGWHSSTLRWGGRGAGGRRIQRSAARTRANTPPAGKRGSASAVTTRARASPRLRGPPSPRRGAWPLLLARARGAHLARDPTRDPPAGDDEPRVLRIFASTPLLA